MKEKFKQVKLYIFIGLPSKLIDFFQRFKQQER